MMQVFAGNKGRIILVDIHNVALQSKSGSKEQQSTTDTDTQKASANL